MPAEEFREFEQAGYAKTIYSLSVHPIADRRTLLTGTMRTATTDEHARSRFRRYWTFGVGSGAHVLVNGVLEMTREKAEEQTRDGANSRRAVALRSFAPFGTLRLLARCGTQRRLELSAVRDFAPFGTSRP